MVRSGVSRDGDKCSSFAASRVLLYTALIVKQKRLQFQIQQKLFKHCLLLLVAVNAKSFLVCENKDSLYRADSTERFCYKQALKSKHRWL